MAIRSVPSIDQLIQANRQINRSLRVYTSKRRKSLFYFCDPEGKEVKAVPVQFPQIITAENVHDPLNLHKGQSSCQNVRDHHQSIDWWLARFARVTR